MKSLSSSKGTCVNTKWRNSGLWGFQRRRRLEAPPSSLWGRVGGSGGLPQNGPMGQDAVSGAHGAAGGAGGEARFEPQREKTGFGDQQELLCSSQIFWGWVGGGETLFSYQTPQNAGSVTTRFFMQRAAKWERSRGNLLRNQGHRRRKQRLTSGYTEAFAPDSDPEPWVFT